MDENCNTSVHGTMLKIARLGVLLIGQPGVGKSELALNLIDRGHRLISDDIAEISRHKNKLFVHAPLLTRNYLQIRGLGLINIRKVLGKKFVGAKQALDLIIELTDKNILPTNALMPDIEYTQLLGLKIPKLKFSISSRQNLSLIIETLVRNFNYQNCHKNFLKSHQLTILENQLSCSVEK